MLICLDLLSVVFFFVAKDRLDRIGAEGSGIGLDEVLHTEFNKFDTKQVGLVHGLQYS